MIRRLLTLALCAVSACASSDNTQKAAPQLPPQQLSRERSELEQRLARGLPDPALERELGWALLVEGHWQRAEAVFEKAIAAAPRDERALLGLALCAQETGQHRKTQDLWLRILESAAQQPALPGGARHPSWSAPLAEVAAHRLLTLAADGSGVEGERRLRERTQALFSHGNLPLEAQQLLGALLGQLLRLSGAEDKARRVDVERGCPAAFFVSGPVGHLPALDLLSPFAADDPTTDAQRGHYARRSGYGCSVTLDSGTTRPGVMFATTWAQAGPGDKQPITVESGGAPWALFVDGRLSYLEQDPLRRRNLWLPLSPGWHSLVIKVGVAGHVQVQLSAPRLTFFDGPLDAAPRPSSSVAVPAYRRGLAEVPQPQSGREEVLRALVRGYQAHLTGDAESGLETVEGLAASVPRFAAFTMLRAALLLEDRTRPDNLMRDQTRGLLEQALKDDPSLLRARLSLATLLLQEEHPNEAQELIEAVPAPKEPNWQLPLLYYRVLKARGWMIEAEKALTEAAALGPSACSVLESKVDLLRERQDIRGALETAGKLAACNPYSDRFADELLEAGKLAAAQKEYERLLGLEPENEEWQGSLARVLASRRGAGDLERARLLRAGLVTRSPRNVSYRVELANLLVAIGQKDEARTLLHDGQKFMPESAELQRALLALGERGMMDAYRIDGRQVIAEFLSKNRGTFDGEPAVLLLDRTVARVLPTGARLTLTHNIIRVLTKDGAGKFGEVKIPEGAELLTLRTIKADGSTREPEEIPEKEGVSAPDLEVGDYVEFEYLEREPPLPAFPRGFLSERFYFASVDAPLDRSEYILIVPKGIELQIDVRGPIRGGRRDVPQAEIRNEGDLRTYTWQKRQAPRMQPEPPLNEAIIEDWLPSVRVASGLSFAGYINWLRDRRIRTLYVGREVRALAKEVAGPPFGESEPAREPPETLIRRARLLDEWVRRNIREGGSIDEPATAVLSRKQGRRSVILMALLRAAGIPCEVWLVRPQNAPHLDGPLPDLTAYQEVLLAVAPGRGPAGQPLLFLDPSLRHLPSGYVKSMLRGAKALRLPEPAAAPPLPSVSFAEVMLPIDGGALPAWRQLVSASGAQPLEAVGAALKDGRRLEMDMTLGKDGSGDVTVRETLTGGPALEWREHVEYLSQEKLRQQLEQRALGFYFPGASLIDLKYGPMEHDDEPMIVEYRFHAPHLARQSGESATSELVLPAPYPVLLSRNYVHLAQRETPLLVQYVQPTVVDAQIHLPAGMRLAQATPPVELSDFGRFVQRVTLAPGGNQLTLHAELQLPLLRVPPERYGQFIDFARRVDSAEESIAVLAVRP